MAAKDVVLLLERSPSTKRSSNRKERWDKTPPTSGNVYDSNPEVDFVLRSPLTSFQSKADIIKEIKASSQFLMLGRDSKLVFHRNTAEDRVKVTRKALANGELIFQVLSSADSNTSSRPLRLHLLRRQFPPLHRRTFIEKRAAIFYDRLDGQLTVKDNTDYRYLAMALLSKAVVRFPRRNHPLSFP